MTYELFDRIYQILILINDQTPHCSRIKHYLISHKSLKRRFLLQLILSFVQFLTNLPNSALKNLIDVRMLRRETNWKELKNVNALFLSLFRVLKDVNHILHEWTCIIWICDLRDLNLRESYKWNKGWLFWNRKQLPEEKYFWETLNS